MGLVAREAALGERVIKAARVFELSGGDPREQEALRDALRRLQDVRDTLHSPLHAPSPEIATALETVEAPLLVVRTAANSLASLPTSAPSSERAFIVRRIRAQEAAFASQMDLVASRIQKVVTERVDRLQVISLSLFGLLAMALGLEGWWVFRPAVRRLEEDFEELAVSEQAVLEAADMERTRIGQEMHDGLCQNLGGLRLLTRAVRVSATDEGVRQSLDMIADLAERSLKMTRSFSHGLYPGEVQSTNLARAIERLGTEAAAVDTFSVSFDTQLDEPPPITDHAAMQLYRIAQEALSNAARHGRPGHVTLKLRCETKRLWLSIQDDGVGMSTTVDMLAGAGLSSMRARARAMQANLEISSTPGTGTRVEVTLDLPTQLA